VQLVHILPPNSGNLQMPELWANVALHNTFERFDRPQAAALFQMLLDVPIEEIVHRGSSSERLTLARGIATVHRHRLQDALGRSPSSLGGDLAVLPDREPAGPAVLVAITDEVGPVAARHDAHAESSKLSRAPRLSTDRFVILMWDLRSPSASFGFGMAYPGPLDGLWTVWERQTTLKN
jgi:hypothetical protein